MKYVIEIPSKADSVTAEYMEDGLPVMYINNKIDDLEPYIEPDRKAIEAEAWEFFKIVSNMPIHELEKVFGTSSWWKIANKYSYQEAKSKYEVWKKQKREFEIGDEVVIDSGEKGCITTIRPSGYIDVIKTNGQYEILLPKEMQKTGRHFDEVEELLKKMRGEE